MKNINKFSALIIAIFQLTSCNKADDDLPMQVEPIDFIVAGEIHENSVLFEFNKLLSNDFGETLGDFPIDLNDDSVMDLEFSSNYTSAMAGGMQSHWSEVLAFTACEILIDTTIKVITSIIDYDTSLHSENTLMPKILNKGDTINKSGVWLSDTSAYLCYNLESPESVDPFRLQKDIFSGWLDCSNKYMGYRIVEEEDTVYGWLELEISGYNKIYIGKSCN